MSARERQFNFRLSDEETQRLQSLCKRSGLDASSVVRMLIKKEFDQVQSTCVMCGGTDFVIAKDNHGHSYMGCASCTIVVPPELLRQ